MDIFPQSLQDQIVLFLENPWSILIVAIGIFILYLIIYLFRIPMTPGTKPYTIMFLEFSSWILLAIVIIENFMRAFFKVDLVDSFVQYINDFFRTNPNDPIVLPQNPLLIKKLTGNVTGNVTLASSGITLASGGNTITTAPTTTITTAPTTTTTAPTTITTAPTTTTLTPTPTPTNTKTIDENTDKKEVFNIAGNNFTYADAPAVCAVYGAELATYDQVEESYEEGGEWCNYGWSEDQMAFFPTQKDTWEKLQLNPTTSHKCGRPGVNGGYIPNPNITFGVNCYGVKPDPTKNDITSDIKQTIGQNIDTLPIPLTPEELAFNQKLQYWKQNAADVLTINSFNEDKWSEF
jgi:voltage-gated potassium channel Kch